MNRINLGAVRPLRPIAGLLAGLIALVGSTGALAGGQVAHLDLAPRLEAAGIAVPHREWAELDIYLPEAWADSARGGFPLLVFQDGQNLFERDSALHHGSTDETWRLAGTLDAMIRSGEIEPVVAVGIHHRGAGRAIDYTLTEDPGERTGGGAAAYLDFVALQLVPFLKEQVFERRIRGGREGLAIAGSSLGGLVAAEAALWFPGMFGGVGALSGAFWWNGSEALGRLSERASEQEAAPVFHLAYGALEDPLIVDGSIGAEKAVRERYGDRARVELVRDPWGRHHEASWAWQARAMLRALLAPRCEAAEALRSRPAVRP